MKARAAHFAPSSASRRVLHTAHYMFAFLLPIAIMCVATVVSDVYPFGSQSFLTEDLKYQYFDFFSWYRDVLTGEESLFYTFSTSLGSNAWGLYSYYLASPFNLLILAFPESSFTEAVFVIVALKLGCIGVATTFYLHHRFALGSSEALALTIAFACSLWTMTNLRNPMWLDALILLPLCAHGIWRLVRSGAWGEFTAALCTSIVFCWYTAYMLVLFSCCLAVIEFLAMRWLYEEHVSAGQALPAFFAALCFALLCSAWTFYPTLVAQLGSWSDAREVELAVISAVLLVLGLWLSQIKFPIRMPQNTRIVIVVICVFFAVACLGVFVFSVFRWGLDGLLEFLRTKLFMVSKRNILASLSFGTWRLDEMPQLFAGLLPLLGTLCLLRSRHIPLSVRLLALIFVLWMFLSAIIRPLYIAWCGFKSPNGFYCRICFFFVFACVWSAALWLSRTSREERGLRGLVVPAVFLALVTAATIYLSTHNISLTFLCIVFIAAYTVCLAAHTPTFSRVTTAALPFIATIELLASACLAWPQLYTGYTQSYHDSYVEAASAEMNSLSELDDGFYRVEKNYTRAGYAAWNDGVCAARQTV